MSFPIFLDLFGRLCVVIGGGSVGRRKASSLLASDARVRLVCLESRPPEAHSENLDWLTEPYRPEHLEGACLVFAAATPEVNRIVVADARARHIWVNVADHPEEGDFILPAVLRRGGLSIAVSTEGASPLLAQVIRDSLDPQFDDAFGDWVELLAEIRPLVLAGVDESERRRLIFHRLCRWEWLERLRREERDSVKAAMIKEVRALVEGAGEPL